jgi:putative transposase
LEVRLKRLYLDRQFYCVVVIRYLQTQYPTLEVIIPVIIRGKKGGTRALLRGERKLPHDP